MKHVFVFILFLSSILIDNGFSQFDSVLIKKNFSNFNDPSKNIAPFGDQNGDGYGDFIAYDCQEGKINVFLGGTQIDTLPYLKISSSGNFIYGFAVIDVNHDTKYDIVIWDNYEQKIKVFYGGEELDSIPDIILEPPQGVSQFFGRMKNAGDFNGDGYDDLVISDPYLPGSNKEIQVSYFFSTYPVFDNIPEMIICGDTLNNIEKYAASFGDINGDGLQDVLFKGGGVPDSTKFMGIILGNAQWDTTSAVIHYNTENIFDVIYTHFINDINGDGKDDILINSYGNFYPYYYTESIIYGSIPFDVVPDVGLNTQNDALLGPAISVGDVNGDGYNDFLGLGGFGYPNARLWLGGSNMNNHNLPVMGWGGSEDFFGGMINKVGDVDGDGINDFAVGTATMTGTCRSGYFMIFKGDTSVTTGIDEQPIQLADDFELYEPYPNPFNPNVTIAFKISKSSSITLTLYDILGKEIKQIIKNQQREAGKYEEVINTSELSLSSGVYVIQLQAVSDNKIIFSSSKKLNLIK